MAQNDLDLAAEQSHAALAAMFDRQPHAIPGSVLRLRRRYSRQSVRAVRARAARTLRKQPPRPASNYRDGEGIEVERIAKYASDELACVVEVERGRTRIGGGEELVQVALRVTSVFRLEHGNWKLVHRHADPITTPRAAASLING